MDLVWDALTPEAFGKIAKGDFELLCRGLLDVEWSDRHDLRSEVVGPSAPDTPDGGRDLLFTVKLPPTEDADAYGRRHGIRPLTPDAGRCAYSCKTGKTWDKKALEEARVRSARVIPILAGGGGLTIFVNVPCPARADSPAAPVRKRKGSSGAPRAEPKRTKRGAAERATATAAERQSLREALAKAYASRMPTGGPTESALLDRIRILDANDLHQFLCGRRPLLPDAIAKALGVTRIAYLQDIDEWWQHHTKDRPPAPKFVPDPNRQGIRDQIVEVLTSRAPDPYDRAVWIVGPPGIGKTRLVLEAFRGDERLRRRLLVAPSHVEGLRAIRDDGIFERFRSLVLVIDDCPAHAVGDVATCLTKLSRDTDAALLVLTPHAVDGLPSTALARRIEVERLGSEETQIIIQGQLGPGFDPEVVRRLAALTEGYPWFAALVAEEMEQGAQPPRTVANAADLALASPKEHGARVAEVVIENARALFAVMLTEDVDWAGLRDEDRLALCEAVGAPSWDALETARRACERRRLLRVRAAGNFKYVTPEILAREVARKLLLPQPPGGPTPLGRRLQRVPQWSARLYERLGRLGLTRDELGMLARDAVAPMHSPGAGLAVFGPSGISGAALLFAARYLPSETAAVLRARLEEVPVDELRERREVRRAIVGALERIAHSPGCFDGVETALFRLASAENEVYGNNATHVWASLFLVPLNLSGYPWADRVLRLRQRCRERSPAARRTALAGVAAALSTEGTFARADGEARPDVMGLWDAREARAEAWLLLLECAGDEDVAVARDARMTVAKRLRSAVWEGVLDRFATQLVGALPQFDEASVRELREAIHNAETYDRDRIAASPSLGDAFCRLVEAVVPRSFPERLRQRVGTWGPASERMTDEARDEEIIREGLAEPDAPLLAEVEWLLSKAAVRSISFAITLGRLDGNHLLLDPLVARTRGGAEPFVLSRYCIGMDAAGRAAELDELLVRWNDDPALVEVAALTLPHLEAHDPRPQLLATAVHRGLVPERALWALTWRRWAMQLTPGVLATLLTALLGQPSAAAAAAALELMLERLDAQPQESGLREPLLLAMERLSREPLVGMPAYAWERGGKHLLDMGAVRDACGDAVRGVLASDDIASEHHWLLVQACEERSPAELWEAVSSVLAEGGHAAVKLVVDLRWRAIGARFPVDRVLDWVGHDRARASFVAQFAQVQADELPGIARGLISRFGAESAEARTLAGALSSAFKAVHSLAEHDRKQLARVRRWNDDADVQIRRWAGSLAQSLTRSEEFNTAYEEHERRRFGT